MSRLARAFAATVGLLIVLSGSVLACPPGTADGSGSTPTASPAGPIAPASSYDLLASYDVTIELHWAAGTLTVTTDMDAENTSGETLTRLELNTVAARLGHLDLLESTVNDVPVNVRASDQTLIVPLPAPLANGGHVSVHTRYKARLLHSTENHDWLWSQTRDVASVYRAIPWLSKRHPFDRPNDGDPFVTQSARHVHVAFDSDTPLVYATSGGATSAAATSASFDATQVRDFNFTASSHYDVVSEHPAGGPTITVMTKWMSHAQRDRAMAVARTALKQYDRWLGQLRCPTVVIAEISAGVSMESPCLVWITRGSGAFADYRVAHELGHQWFYALVGNDQATNPFLDEAVTDFLARTLLHQLRGSQCSTAPLDGSIYVYLGSCYYETIYIQGSDFLDHLRTQLGDGAFWSTLQAFWHDHRWQVTNTKALLDAFLAVGGKRLLPEYRKRFPSLYP
jgi:hypothetical protein